MENLEKMVNSCVLVQTKNNLKFAFSQTDIQQGEKLKDKQKILEYLKSFKPSWITSANVIDRFLNAPVNIADNSYDNGVFAWSESDIYHFDKYNISLEKEFIDFLRGTIF